MSDNIVERLKAAIAPLRENHACVHTVDEGAAAFQIPDSVNAGQDTWGDIARLPSILEHFAGAMEAQGVVGESRIAKLVYLVLTSRFLDRPVSLVVKGPSSGGKSFVTQQVLRFFPPEAYYALSAMSEKALIYSKEPLSHRHLVLYEAEGMKGDFLSYILRSLLSEGRIVYDTVETGKSGIKPLHIEKEGPTGLLLTTTAANLHPENETRLLSATVQDTPEQTRAILLAKASGLHTPPDLTAWIELQCWLAQAEHCVEIPFLGRLAELVDVRSVRIRRDFNSILALIQAHAILHQATRSRRKDDSIVAEISDYVAVHDLVADIVAVGVQASVDPAIRETVDAVQRAGDKLSQENQDGYMPFDRFGEVNASQVADELGIGQSSALRRVWVATREGYLVNNQTQKYQPAKLVLGNPLPEEEEVLPSPDKL